MKVRSTTKSSDISTPLVFISHTDRSNADKKFTDSVVRRFKKEGIAYWIDREHPFDFDTNSNSDGPSPNNPLFFHLCEAIADSDLLLFILSAASVQREFCRLEFDPRILFGPGKQIMEGKSVLIVKLDKLEFNEIELVLTSLCDDSNVVDMESTTSREFWQIFTAAYKKVNPAPKDNSWRQHAIFQPEEEPVPLSEDELASLQAEGHKLLAKALTKIDEKNFEWAEELLADAYQALHRTEDKRGVIDVLYQTFIVDLRIGLDIFVLPQEVETIGSIVIKDTKQMALDNIRYAMKCLRACIDESAKLGDKDLSLEMEKRYDEAVTQLREYGIEQAPK